MEKLPPHHLSNDLRQRIVKLCVLEEQLTPRDAAARLCIDFRTAEAVLEVWMLTGDYKVQPMPPRLRHDRNMQPDDEVWFLQVIVEHPSLFGFQYVAVFNRHRRSGPGDVPISIWHIRDVIKVRCMHEPVFCSPFVRAVLFWQWPLFILFVLVRFGIWVFPPQKYDITRKKLTHVMLRRDLAARIKFMNMLCLLDPAKILFMDEFSKSRSIDHNPYGYTFRGMRAYGKKDWSRYFRMNMYGCACVYACVHVCV